jgi:protein gp37
VETTVGDQTAIEWADATWNPWWGCTKVSPACAHCYAETLANRFHHGLWRGQRRRVQDWSLPAKVDRRAAREGRRLRLFVASMADVFDDHPAVAEWRRDALDLLAGLRNVDVLLLTKRPENVMRMVPRRWLDDAHCDFRAKPELWPAHVWVGTTVEDQQRADERIPHLLRVPARVRFLSVEPMLGPVDLAYTCFNGADSFGTMPGIHWVIAGGESGAKARPSHPDWLRSVRDQCRTAGVPFLFKQWGEWAPGDDVDANGTGWPGMHEPHPEDGGARRHTWPDAPVRESARRLGKGEIPHEVGGDTTVLRVGKKAAGRLLDGVQHDGFPEVTRG